MNDCVRKIADKLSHNERLNFDDALAMYVAGDLVGLGRLAEQAMLNRVGKGTYYSINRHINYTNICTMGCAFCGFSRTVDQADGYLMSSEDVVNQARDAHAHGATEVHIVGGIHPELDYAYYLDCISGIRQACPDLHIKAFTAVEIIDIAKKGDRTIDQTLAELKDAGLNALPGGGAEILQDSYFEANCPKKTGPDSWIEVHRIAHQLDLPTNATMLFGFRETLEDRIHHLLTLRDVQDEALAAGRGAFQCFVPLPYITPAAHRKGETISVDAVGELKTIAICRLVLDNFDYIKAFWPMLGVKQAQIALAFGANDMDGTVQHYTIVDKTVDNDTDNLSEGQLNDMILQADREPIKRDGYYHPIEA